MIKKLGILPKKAKKLSASQRLVLKTTLVSASVLAFSGCRDGGSSAGTETGSTQAVALNPIHDITVKEGALITLEPTATNSSSNSLVFSYSGYMTKSTKQTAIGDAGVYSVRVTVSDSRSSNSQDVKIFVYTANVNPQALHLIRRITFGLTPSLYKEVGALGIQGFIDQQLDPASIDDSKFKQRIAGLTTNTRADLRSWTLMHMIYSRRQLLEVMTWFWDNHFNTDINSLSGSKAINKSQEKFERRENEAFRGNALGNFRQLLEISSKSPAMLLYLNNAQNRKRDSNENYARELLELHTLGVNGGYTHLDVEAGAEIFTGWQLRNLSFFFNAAQHNNTAQRYLGVSIPSGGLAQGEQVLDILAAHASTARFICTKLVAFFVNDIPPKSLVDQCAVKFKATVNDPNQITQVLRIILTSSEFNAPANKLAKVKSPLEFATSLVRVLEGESTGQRLQIHIANMGLGLYENPWPTGWSDKGVDWMSSGLLLERIKAVESILRVNKTESLRTDLLAYFSANGATTADAIVDFLLTHLLGEYPALARQQAIAFLIGSNGFNLTDSNANTRLRHLLEIITSYPQFHYQ